MTARLERAARARELRAAGCDYKTIAAELGVSRSYAGELVTDPDGSQARARKASYSRPCPECGKPMYGGDGPQADGGHPGVGRAIRGAADGRGLVADACASRWPGVADRAPRRDGPRVAVPAGRGPVLPVLERVPARPRVHAPVAGPPSPRPRRGAPRRDRPAARVRVVPGGDRSPRRHDRPGRRVSPSSRGCPAPYPPRRPTCTVTYRPCP
jgi:hypothetical protein